MFEELPDVKTAFGENELGMLGWIEHEGTEPLHADEERRPDQYKGERLALTELGRAIMAGEEDFSRHNPIHRWWGGTELTNERLWRWDRRSRLALRLRET